MAHSRVPLEDVYVGATGEGWVQGLYAVQPQLRTQDPRLVPAPLRKGTQTGGGDGRSPRIRTEMSSGQNNLIVSEIGFCAVSVAREKCLTSAAPAADPAEAASALEKELGVAFADHRAGWLRAALVYSRTDSGWAMQRRRAGSPTPG